MERRNACIGIQIRENSTRFPYKWAALIQGKPIYQYIHDRLTAVCSPEDIWYLVPCGNDTLIDVLESNGYNVFVDYEEAHENDVLGRYARFLYEFPEYDFVVRYTADDPFRDVWSMAALLISMAQNPSIGVGVTIGLPDGMNNEVFSRGKILELAMNESIEREHIGHLFDTSALDTVTLCYNNQSKLSVTLDFQKDLDFINFVAGQVEEYDMTPLEVLCELERGKIDG